MFRAIFSMTLVAVALAACTGSTAAPEMVTAAIPPLSQEGEPRTDGWQPGERLVKRRDRGAYAAIDAYRHGTAPGGSFYRFQANGFGTLRIAADLLSPTWTFDCTRDAMTDRRDCRLHAPETLAFFFSGREPQWVCIVGHTYPGKTGAIRIDGAKPIETNERGCVDGAVAKQLAGAKEVVVRYVTWPYKAPQDTHPSMSGLADALALMAYVYSNIDRLAFE
jgi:hypothetical protein